VFEAKFKYVRVWVFDKQRSIINIFSAANKAVKFCGISNVTLSHYLKSGKLFKNKYYFSRTSSLL